MKASLAVPGASASARAGLLPSQRGLLRVSTQLPLPMEGGGGPAGKTTPRSRGKVPESFSPPHQKLPLRGAACGSGRLSRADCRGAAGAAAPHPRNEAGKGHPGHPLPRVPLGPAALAPSGPHEGASPFWTSGGCNACHEPATSCVCPQPTTHRPPSPPTRSGDACWSGQRGSGRTRLRETVGPRGAMPQALREEDAVPVSLPTLQAAPQTRCFLKQSRGQGPTGMWHRQCRALPEEKAPGLCRQPEGQAGSVGTTRAPSGSGHHVSLRIWHSSAPVPVPFPFSLLLHCVQ